MHIYGKIFVFLTDRFEYIYKKTKNPIYVICLKFCCHHVIMTFPPELAAALPMGSEFLLVNEWLLTCHVTKEKWVTSNRSGHRTIDRDVRQLWLWKDKLRRLLDVPHPTFVTMSSRCQKQQRNWESHVDRLSNLQMHGYIAHICMSYLNMHAHNYVCLHVCVYACINVCMCVCLCVLVFIEVGK